MFHSVNIYSTTYTNERQYLNFAGFLACLSFHMWYISILSLLLGIRWQYATIVWCGTLSSKSLNLELIFSSLQDSANQPWISVQ